MRCLLIIATLLLAACVSQPQPGRLGDPDDFDTTEAAKTRISLGLTYLKNGNYSQAKFNLDKALQFAPRYADAHYSLAYYYQVVGENELAEASYQKAMDFAPRNPDIANTYGAFLCQRGKYEQAKTYFLQAVNSANYISTAETYENLALCSQSQGQVKDAITYLQSALNHQPSRSRSLLMLAQLYAADDQWQASRDALRRYEKLARVTPETLWLSVKIEQALGNDALAKGYGDMLIRMYPRHPNTTDYIAKRNKTSEPDIQVEVAQPQSVKVPKSAEPKQSLAQTQEAVQQVAPQQAAAEQQVVENEPTEPVTQTVTSQQVEETLTEAESTVTQAAEDVVAATDAPVDELEKEIPAEVEQVVVEPVAAAAEQTETPPEEALPVTTVDEQAEIPSEADVPLDIESDVAGMEAPVDDLPSEVSEAATEEVAAAEPSHHIVQKKRELVSYFVAVQYKNAKID